MRPAASFRLRAAAIVASNALVAAFWASPNLQAQPGKAPAPPAANSAPLPTGKAAVQEFESLMQKRMQLEQRMQQLEKDFEAADANGKQKIREGLVPIMQEFQQRTFPRLVELAPIVYQQDPKQFDAGEIVMETAYSRNQFDLACQIADQLLKSGRKSSEVLNVGGAAEFARQNFPRSQQLLEEAQKSNLLDEQVGGMFLEASKKYGAMWAQEQQVRAREAKATGDMALPQVELNTTRGKVVLELFENEAPNTVANFVSLVEKKLYDGTRFHRVIPNFMVQGGDPNSKDNDPSNDGMGGPGYAIPCECYRNDFRRHFRGSLSMAHGAEKDTGGSQFFITHIPTYWLNVDMAKTPGHTVFGRVVSGMEVVDAMEIGDQIVSARVLRKRNHPYQPKTLPEPQPKPPLTRQPPQ